MLRFASILFFWLFFQSGTLDCCKPLIESSGKIKKICSETGNLIIDNSGVRILTDRNLIDQDTTPKKRSNKTGGPGDTGGTGNQGNSGTSGDQSGTGGTGQPGDTGHPGDTGGTGNQGNSGTSGDQSGTGGTGQPGDTGHPGDTGGTGQAGGTDALSDYLSYNWGGSISLYETMGAGENQSLLAALTPGGEYNISKNWIITLSFKPVEKSSKLLIYKVERATLMDFSDEYAQTMFRMEREGRRIEGRARETAEARGRSLSAAECDLRLIIDTVSSKYWVKGEIKVEGIKIKGTDEVDIKVKPVNKEIDEEAEGTTGIDEEIEISGTFTAVNPGNLPEEMKGTKDLLKEVPEEFREFLEDLGGAQTMLLDWNLYRKL